jgi:DNA-binding transcriptional LysR family regulator
MIQIQRLEGFYRVARAEGYARAVRSFPYPITEPGVHQQVKKLEAEVGQRLFERVSKDRVVLTAAGRTLFELVAPFMERLPAVVEAIRGGTQGGTLRVHAEGHALRYVLPPWLRRLQIARPDIRVELTEARTSNLEAIRAGEADCLVAHLALVPEDVETREVARVRAFVALPSHHPCARRARVRLEDLQGEPFVAYQSDRTLRQLQLEALRLHGFEPKATHSADTAETILGFVAAGLGFSLVPSALPGGPRVAGVTVFPLRPKAEFPIYAAWRRAAAPNPLLAAALALARVERPWSRDHPQ